MSSLFAAFSVWVVLSGSPAHILRQSAQGSLQQGRPEVSCWYMKAENRPWKNKLWDGYEISLGPTPHAADNPDQACTAAIYNQAGHVVFRTTGYNVVFDEKETGQDFDGDGNPEVVFKTDNGGGMHCCWVYNVISLSPKPHKLFDIDAPGAVRFEEDSQGKMVIWQALPGPYGFTSMARAPFATKVLRVRDGKLFDATPEFCSRIFSVENEDYRNLSPENISKLQASDGSKHFDNESIITDLLSRALQHVFCRQFDAALNDLDLWPEATRAKMKAAFSESIKQDYSEFASRLTPAAVPASSQTSNAPPRIGMFLNLGNQETFLAAKLTAAEREQIIDQVEKTSFDFPDGWESEVRVRRVSLGEAEGLIVRGTRLLCGGTGNCETWVFRRFQGKWFNLFEQEAPVVSGFGFDEESTGGIKNFLVSANSSAAKETRVLFKFDGRFYRQSDCYDVWVNGSGAEKVEKVPCK